MPPSGGFFLGKREHREGNGRCFVILCGKGKAQEALQRMRDIMGTLKLTVNEEVASPSSGTSPLGRPNSARCP
jgi:hypothetical protein